LKGKIPMVTMVWVLLLQFGPCIFIRWIRNQQMHRKYQCIAHYLTSHTDGHNIQSSSHSAFKTLGNNSVGPYWTPWRWRLWSAETCRSEIMCEYCTLVFSMHLLVFFIHYDLGSLVGLGFKAPPGTSYSYITIHLIGTT
jgi:hypothetical protein